uniref:NAD(P)-binding domain-containing protein n=1 Tax=Arcella intermedia TaxID=1963864 RepID=A0A6B2LDE0_9EUKA
MIGGTKGIGLSIAEKLMRSGVHVTLVGRTEPKQVSSHPNVEFVGADLSSMREARALADRMKEKDFDAIFMTIGVAPLVRSYTAEGIESDLAVSYLCRHVVMDQMLKNGFGSGRPESSKPRVISIAYPGLWFTPGALDDINWERTPYDFKAHINTHIFNEALVHFLSQKHLNIEIIGLAPGWLSTPGLNSMTQGTIFEKVLPTLVDVLFQTKEHFVENVVIPLLMSPEIKSGSVFNSVGTEILPNSWLAVDLLKRSKELVTLNHNLLRKYNLTEDPLDVSF